MEEKNGFHQPENQFPLAGIRLFFKNWISTSRKKSPNKRILFQVDRKLVSTSKNGEFVSGYVFARHEKTAYIGRNIYKIKANRCQQQ